MTATRILLALACVSVAAWVAASRWETLLAGHPAYPILLVVVALTGIAIGVRARRVRRRGAARVTAGIAGAVALVLVLAGVVWLRPFPATPTAAYASSETVEVVHTLSTWELRPRGGPRGAGVVFYPGALVDPRAYLGLLRPLAETGHLVVVVNAPLDVALLAPGAVGTAIDAHPEVRTWTVGGHSLGGVQASTATADPRVRGLFLWASYPSQDISGTPVAAASISGDRDGLATPADIEASRAKLPPGTAFTIVAGGVHAYFGDYGPQPGDGEPGVARAEAQRQIEAATSELVGRAG